MKRITVRLQEGTGTSCGFSFNDGAQIRVSNLAPGICERTIQTLALSLRYLIQQYAEAVRSTVTVHIPDLAAFNHLQMIRIERIRETPPYLAAIEPLINSFQDLRFEYSPVDG